MVAASIVLKPSKEHVILRGHPWLFSGAIARIEGKPANGAILPIRRADGKTIALGAYHHGSDIAVRIISLDPEIKIDADFWRSRIANAVALRTRIIPPETTACRMINAEGDGLPGLVVDRYGDWLVLSLSTLLLDRLRETLCELLVAEMTPAGIYERSEGRARQREGLDTRSGMLWGEPPPQQLEIRENGLRFLVDLVEGQKTGFFIDQRSNRSLVESISRDARVLNCFAYSGGFSLYAARGGARQVTSVELSAHAAGMCRTNLKLNLFDPEQHPVVTADVFDYLRSGDQRFDLIILDPPAFAKSQKDIQRASRGYKEINLQAMRHLEPGGWLATFSCSNHVDKALFTRIVLAAAADAGRTVQLIQELAPGGDHPVLLAHEEGRYLKGLLLRLV
ncbi:MAG TPA: class I SAM-dependent rRNA methyltransferase [bacterium]|nr:class I SAM-dependent rRNA methyltransferase [bacterium]HQI49547.1 class I SAM-dependent rRNA methyltransferase [bacterium]HQJ65577.1 class I SAM-dependent rRNA methyltransferase [bacterium]